jgi:hypothetical protein
MLANFLGVLPILTPPLCALAFIMCSKSNPLVVFALDLMSTYEGEHMIFNKTSQWNYDFSNYLRVFHCLAKLVLPKLSVISNCALLAYLF